jgi:hypothetical protein
MARDYAGDERNMALRRLAASMAAREERPSPLPAALTIGGAAVGTAFGQPMLGAQVGSLAGQVVAPGQRGPSPADAAGVMRLGDPSTYGPSQLQERIVGLENAPPAAGAIDQADLDEHIRRLRELYQRSRMMAPAAGGRHG